MKKNWKDEKHPIDIFYNEVKVKTQKRENNWEELNQKLEKTSEILKIIEEVPVDFSIDTMNILLKAEEIKKKSLSKKEIFFFLLVSISLLTIYFSLVYFYNTHILFYTQVILLFLAPWLLIPISFLKERGMK